MAKQNVHRIFCIYLTFLEKNFDKSFWIIVTRFSINLHWTFLRQIVWNTLYTSSIREKLTIHHTYFSAETAKK